jgi:hypothetical protein
MTAPLTQALDEARAALERAPNGHIPLPHRRRVLAALGAPRRRARLALAAAERALPAWRAAGRGDLAERILEDTRAVLSGGLAGEAAQRRSDEHRSDCDALDPEEVSLPAFYAAWAAAAALSAAIHDEGLLDTELDEQLDPDEWDAALWASAVCAAGFPWEEGSDAARRREHWQWWLDAAAAA